MRVDVKKFLFAGLEEEKKTFFKEAQKLGVIQFIAVKESESQEMPQEVVAVTQALKVIRGLEPIDQVELDDLSSADKVVDEVLQLKTSIGKLDETLRVLKLDASRVDPFGDFSWDDLHKIEVEGKLHIQFFCSRRGLRETLVDHEALIYITSDEDLDYFVSFAKEITHYDRLIEIKFDKTSGEIKREIDETNRLRHEKEEKLRNYARYSNFLHQALYSHLNHYYLEHAEGFAKAPTQGLFAVEGWIPETKIAQVAEYAASSSVFMDQVAIEENDRVPTYLENEGFRRIGEDLIGIYDTPANSDKDPSLWVLMGFGVFFAFIVGDGGYGLIYLALFLFLHWKYPHLTGLKRRMVRLGTFLSVCCVIWGFLIGSFFGMTLGINNPIRKYSPITHLIESKVQWIMNHDPETVNEWQTKYPSLAKATDAKTVLNASPELLTSLADGVLLELALFFGVIHIIIGMLRYITHNWAFAGWILFLVGAYLYFPFYLDGPSILNYFFHINLEEGGKVGLQLIGIGITLAVVVSIIRFKLLGLTEVMNVIQVFADVLSYLRLYALGLAGGIVGGVINDAAIGLPVIFAIVLSILGHTINMVLGIMSGVIHGLRLNFLEWYHYSFEGGGKKFKPLDLHQNNLD